MEVICYGYDVSCCSCPLYRIYWRWKCAFNEIFVVPKKKHPERWFRMLGFQAFCQLIKHNLRLHVIAKDMWKGLLIHWHTTLQHCWCLFAFSVNSGIHSVWKHQYWWLKKCQPFSVRLFSSHRAEEKWTTQECLKGGKEGMPAFC